MGAAAGSTIGPASSALGPASSSPVATRPGPSTLQTPRGGPGIASSSPAVSSPMHTGGPGAVRSMSADPRAAGGVSIPLRQAQGQHAPPPLQSHQRGQPQLSPLYTGQVYRPGQNGPRSADPYARDPRYAQQQQAAPHSAGGMPPPGGQPGYPQGMRSPQAYEQQLPHGAARPVPSQQQY